MKIRHPLNNVKALLTITLLIKNQIIKVKEKNKSHVQAKNCTQLFTRSYNHPI